MIFGIRAVMEAIQAGREVDKIMVKKDLQGDLIRELGELLKGQMVPVQRVPVERLNRITRKNHQGVIAFVSAVTYHRLEDLIPFVFEQGRDPFIVLLDGVTDVRNFGAIVTVGIPLGQPGSTNMVEVLTTGKILLSGTPLVRRNATNIG